MQQPDATQVAGLHTWLSLGRQVRRGEKGIRIFAPIRVRKATDSPDEIEDADRTDTSQLRFKPVTVFDISQTDGFRRRRNLGQIGRAAFVLYWRNLPLVAVIGSAFFLLGTLASSIQGPIAVRDIVDSPFTEAFLVVMVGSLQATIALLIFESAMTYALGEMADGLSPSFRDVYHGLLSRFWNLVLARLPASLYVIGLFVSVVGIPWGVHRSVSWLFTEQMVVVEKRRPSDALRESRALVRGSWLRTLGFIIMFVVLLIVPGTIIAVAMLLFASPPTSDTIYLVNGLLYGLLFVPIFSISKVLLYFDLRTLGQDRESSPQTTLG